MPDAASKIVIGLEGIISYYIKGNLDRIKYKPILEEGIRELAEEIKETIRHESDKTGEVVK